MLNLFYFIFYIGINFIFKKFFFKKILCFIGTTKKSFFNLSWWLQIYLLFFYDDSADIFQFKKLLIDWKIINQFKRQKTIYSIFFSVKYYVIPLTYVTCVKLWRRIYKTKLFFFFLFNFINFKLSSNNVFENFYIFYICAYMIITKYSNLRGVVYFNKDSSVFWISNLEILLKNLYKKKFRVNDLFLNSTNNYEDKTLNFNFCEHRLKGLKILKHQKYIFKNYIIFKKFNNLVNETSLKCKLREFKEYLVNLDLKTLTKRIYPIRYTSTNTLKYITKAHLNLTKIYFLRKNKIFNKSRYSRNRQLYRTGVYWCLWVSIFLGWGLYFIFYRYTLNFGYLWWLIYFGLSFFILLKAFQYRLYNLKILTNEIVKLIYWIYYFFVHFKNKFTQLYNLIIIFFFKNIFHNLILGNIFKKILISGVMLPKIIKTPILWFSNQFDFKDIIFYYFYPFNFK